MRSLSLFTGGLVVTGSSGFVGTRLCRAADDRAGGGQEQKLVGTLDLPTLQGIARRAPVAVLAHLAASGGVVIPLKDAPEQVANALHDTWRFLHGLDPAVALYASSCAVYGHSGPRPVAPSWGNVNPVSAYGFSKASTELLVDRWAREQGRCAVVLRIGNVIGPGCRGLIPYLVSHAVRHPDGKTPASMRGAGRVVRDYVPVEHVVKAFLRAAAIPIQRGQSITMNIGSGRGLTNGEIAHEVASALRERGTLLDVRFEKALGEGEARRVILDVERSARLLRLEPPDAVHVRASVRTSAVYWLDRLTADAGRKVAAAA
jgi:nucleoside-diphosphate-sugar epimerase